MPARHAHVGRRQCDVRRSATKNLGPLPQPELGHQMSARVVLPKEQRLSRRTEDEPLTADPTDRPRRHGPPAPIRQVQKHPFAGALITHEIPVAVRQ